jgi:hypothetical protein
MLQLNRLMKKQEATRQEVLQAEQVQMARNQMIRDIVSSSFDDSNNVYCYVGPWPASEDRVPTLLEWSNAGLRIAQWQV